MTTVRFLLIEMLLFSLLAVSVAHADDQDQQILLSAGDLIVTEQDLQQELLLLPEIERTQTLATPTKLKELLGQIFLGKRMIAETERLGLEQTPLAQARLAAARRRALSETLRDHVQKQIEPPDFAALAREHYTVSRDEFRLPDRFKAAHILKKVNCDCERESQRQKIEALLTRLKAGEDFAALAKAESEDTGSAEKGGELGDWVKRDDLVAPFADALAKLDTGQLSDIVETQYGFHIVKLLDRQLARQQSLEEVQQSLEQRLRQTYTQEQLRKQLGSYMPGADAKYNESALNALSRGP
ncbi:MAG: peptidylprolyl isomerase [Candidatus Competibacter sp.]|nr:peptidylprolyl isomerase [Candidatus Competibacter sp.]MDG4582717.1 peptidylprolyl isomerase [Candidatus Competibacter sp.]